MVWLSAKPVALLAVSQPHFVILAPTAAVQRRIRRHTLCNVLRYSRLAVRYLRSQRYTVDELQKESGPSKRQSERRAAYLDFDSSQMPLIRAFRSISASHSAAPPVAAAPIANPSGSGGHAASQRPAIVNSAQSMFQRFPGALSQQHGSVRVDTAQVCTLSVSNWCCSLRLANPHTQCYINACILALGHATSQRHLCPALTSIFQLCQAHPLGEGTASRSGAQGTHCTAAGVVLWNSPTRRL